MSYKHTKIRVLIIFITFLLFVCTKIIYSESSSLIDSSSNRKIFIT